MKREGARGEDDDRSPSDAAHSLGPPKAGDRRVQNNTQIHKPVNGLRIPELTSPPKRPIMLAALPGESQEAANQRAMNAVNTINKRSFEAKTDQGEAVPRLGEAPTRASYQFPSAAQPVKRPKGDSGANSKSNAASNLPTPSERPHHPPLVQAYAVKSKQGFIRG